MVWRHRQTSFAAGELAPGLYGRTDFAKYGSGCRTALNWFVTPWGCLANRPGTKKVHTIANDVLYSNRIIPFVFSNDDAVILMFTHYRMYVFAYDSTVGHVVKVDAEVSVLNEALRAPYASTDLDGLVWSQVGDVITFVHNQGQYPPYELRRLAGDNTIWEFRLLDTSIPTFPAYGGVPMLLAPPPEGTGALPWEWQVTRIVEDSEGNVFETQPHTVNNTRTRLIEEWSPARNYPHIPAWSADAEEIENVWIAEDTDNFYVCLVPNGPDNFAREQRPIAGQTTAYWECHAASGYYSERLGSGMPDAVWILPDAPAVIEWLEPPAFVVTPDDAMTILNTRVYRGRDGIFGFVGQVDGDATQYIDEGATPDWSRPPPAGLNPFAVEYPRAVCMFEGRRFFGGTDSKPAGVFGSAVEAYRNFDKIQPAKDSDALAFELATNRLEKIRSLLPRQQLLILTDTSEWAASGSGQGELLTPTSIAARPISHYGSGLLRPLDVNGAVWFVQTKGTVPRALAYNENGQPTIVDLSTLSRHLFIWSALVDWVWAEDPFSLVWAAREDGVLLSCTVVPEHELLGWAQHRLGGEGWVRSLATIPEGYEDGVYMVVERYTPPLQTLERLSSRVVQDVEDCVFLDSSVTHDGRNTNTSLFAAVSSAGGQRERYRTVTVVIDEDGEVYTGKILRVNGNNDDTVLVHLHTRDNPDEYTGQLLEDLPAAMDGQSYYDWALCVQTVTGLGHLNGREVYALLEGNVAGPFTVDGGMVNVVQSQEEAVAVAHVGLQYNCDFESLDVPEEKGREKIPVAVTVELEATRGGWVGQDLDHLREIQTRQVGHVYASSPLLRLEERAVVSGEWSPGGRVAFRQVDPLPSMILGIMREIQVGGP